jgi:N6-L-threonylcarbamoyladenine synthase
MYLLGIETSCDETAAAIVRDGREVLSSVVHSQVDVHHIYGGVVPELASRKHIESILPVVEAAFTRAGLSPQSIEAVAATRGPGLVGALLVGFSWAKAYAYAKKLRFIGVNHLEAHVNSVFLEAEVPSFPFVALLVSGGHTSLYHVTDHTCMELLGQTRDDAAGEAFDKVAKMLDLGYPGGEVIDRLAREGNPERVKFPRPFVDKATFDFSFSGLKTAVKRYLTEHPEEAVERQADIGAGFQEAVVDVLCDKLVRAAVEKKCRRVALVGGVAANSRLRQRLRRDGQRAGLEVFIPSIELCGDNAAMVAAIGYHYLGQGMSTELQDDVFSRSR